MPQSGIRATVDRERVAGGEASSSHGAVLTIEQLRVLSTADARREPRKRAER
jgi:hypothetical protein